MLPFLGSKATNAMRARTHTRAGARAHTVLTRANAKSFIWIRVNNIGSGEYRCTVYAAKFRSTTTPVCNLGQVIAMTFGSEVTDWPFD